MPRIRNPKFQTQTRINWDRSSGGRLLRLDNPAQFVDSDILVYNIDNVNLFAVAQHSSDQRIPPLVPFTSTESDQVFNFEKLERHNSLEPILNFLGISDIEALSKVSSFLSCFIANNYILRVSLPLPSEMCRKLANRKVLALTSCCNLNWLPEIHSMEPFNQLNLTNLRELKLIGKNIDDVYLCLSPTYHMSLQHLIKALTNANSLKKLEILTDSTKFSVDTAKMMVKLHNLEELVLHNIGHFHNSASESYRVDVEIANLIIKNSLLNKRISVLHLVKFELEKHADKLVIHSDNLKQLHILQCKETDKLDWCYPLSSTLRRNQFILTILILTFTS